MVFFSFWSIFGNRGEDSTGDVDTESDFEAPADIIQLKKS